MMVEETTSKPDVSVPSEITGTPLMSTAVAPVKFVPKIVTLPPTGPLPGVKAVMVGAGDAVTVKSAGLLATPPAVVTRMGPVVAPAGTVTNSSVSVLIRPVSRSSARSCVATALNVTAGVPLAKRFVPKMTTGFPTGPLLIGTAVMVGAGAG